MPSIASEVEKEGIYAIVAEAGTVFLESIGKESDEFVKAVAEIYGVKQAVRKFRNSGPLESAAFGGTSTSIQEGQVTFKIFGEAEKGEDYFEFFITYEPKANRIWFGEKDEEYRAPTVRRIGGKDP